LDLLANIWRKDDLSKKSINGDAVQQRVKR